jgi:hypothetical protein
VAEVLPAQSASFWTSNELRRPDRPDRQEWGEELRRAMLATGPSILPLPIEASSPDSRSRAAIGFIFR